MGGYRRIRAAVVAVVSLATCWVGLGAPAPARADAAVVIDDPAGAGQLFALANAERAAAGLPTLELRADVTDIAAEQSRRMAAAGDISHNDAYFTAEVRQRLGARALGENVAMNTSMDDAHRRLMNSPGHRANLMNPKFTVVGMAVARTADGMGFITQDFVEPSSAAARPLPVPPPVVAPAPAPDPAPEATPAPTHAAPAPPPAAPGAPAVPAAAPAPAPVLAASTDAPAVVAPAPTTTAPLAVVSVVTAPISASGGPGRAAREGGTSHVLPIGLALALLLLALAGAVRAHRR